MQTEAMIVNINKKDLKNIWFISDLHFCHDKDFLYSPRGFSSIQEHDKNIINNWNSIIKTTDEVYCLGDFMLDDCKKAIEYIKNLNGRVHLLIGNHDTQQKIELYKTCENIVSIELSKMIRIGKYFLWISHYPTLVRNIRDTKHIWSIHGHTHSKEKFSKEYYHCYNVSLDAHNNSPINLEKILNDIKEKEKEIENDI